MKKNRMPSEYRKISLFTGDWEELEHLLSPKRVKPTEFIRELVHNTIERIRSKQALHERSIELQLELSIEDLQQKAGGHN